MAILPVDVVAPVRCGAELYEVMPTTYDFNVSSGTDGPPLSPFWISETHARCRHQSGAVVQERCNR
jgi:hypothetical protein